MRNPLSVATTLCLILQVSVATADDITVRVLLFGDSNTWGARPSTTAAGERYPVAETWGYLLDERLPDNVEVVVEGLGGRTTDFDPDPTAPIRWSGTETLPSILASHMPIDVIVVMLGTNDLLAPYNRSTSDIASGVERLIESAKAAHQVGTVYAPPDIVLVAPPVLGSKVNEPPFDVYFAGGREKSQQFSSMYASIAERLNVSFVDAASVVRLDSDDGVHFTLEDHAALAAALEPIVIRLID